MRTMTNFKPKRLGADANTNCRMEKGPRKVSKDCNA